LAKNDQEASWEKKRNKRPKKNEVEPVEEIQRQHKSNKDIQ